MQGAAPESSPSPECTMGAKQKCLKNAFAFVCCCRSPGLCQVARDRHLLLPVKIYPHHRQQPGAPTAEPCGCLRPWGLRPHGQLCSKPPGSQPQPLSHSCMSHAETNSPASRSPGPCPRPALRLRPHSPSSPIRLRNHSPSPPTSAACLV